MAFDAVNKVVIAFTIGKRKLPQAKELLHEIHERFPDQLPYFTSDELDHYISAIHEEYGTEKTFPKTGKKGRPKKPVKEIPPELVYSQVHKSRENGKVKKIEKKIIFGTEEQVKANISQSPVSHSINTTFIERNNLTLRQQNGRLQRKTLQFSKENELLYAQLYLFLGYYHFLRPHQGLKTKTEHGKIRGKERTPIRAASITDHIWTFREFFSFPINLYKGGDFN